MNGPAVAPEETLSVRKARTLAALALVVPVFVLCAPFLFGSKRLRAGDFQAEVAPRIAVGRQGFLKDGEFLRWNPYQFAGTPILGNGHGSYYYPGSWIYFVLSSERAIELLVFLHLLLAAGGMYRWARGFRVSRGAAVLAGLSYALGFGAISRIYAGHLYYTITHGVAPWFLYALGKTLRAPTLAHALAFSIWTGVTVVSGAPQWVFLLGWLAVGLSAWEILPRIIQKEPWLRTAAVTVGAAGLGLALSSVELLPGLNVASHSIRNSRLADRSLFEEWYATSIPDLVGFLMPHFPWSYEASTWMSGEGWHEKSAHVGTVPLLAMGAAFFGKRRRQAAFFGSVALLAVMAAMALVFPVHDLLRAVLPGYASFRLPSRMLWLAHLSLPLLAAFGWDALADRDLSPSGRRWAGALTLSLGVLGVSSLAFLYRATPEACFFAATCAGAAILFALVPTRPRAVAGAVLLLAGELSFLGIERLDRGPGGYLDAPWYSAHIGAVRADYRILDLTRYDQKPSAFGFRMLKGYSHPILKTLSDLYGMAWEGERRIIYESLSDGERLTEPEILRNLNVRWIITWGPPPFPELKEIARTDQFHLYEDPEAKPLAFFERGRGELASARPTLNSIELRVRAEEPDSVVISEAWMPGWRAWMDGRTVPVSPAMVALMKVDVPRGSSRILLVYDPLEWRIGKAISLGAALLWGMLLGFHFFRLGRPPGVLPAGTTFSP
jgi:hypothetical protein